MTLSLVRDRPVVAPRPAPAHLLVGYADPVLGPLALGSLCWPDPDSLQADWRRWPVLAASPWSLRLLDAQGHVLDERRVSPDLLDALLQGQLLSRLAQARVAARFGPMLVV